MAKKVLVVVKLQIPAGQATPTPPVGPALGQHGVNIMEFCKTFNAQTQDKGGLIIPVVITIYADRSFTFITKTPPASVLLKRAAGLEKGSPESNRQKVGKCVFCSGSGDRTAQAGGPEHEGSRFGHPNDRRNRPKHGDYRGGIEVGNGKLYREMQTKVDRRTHYPLDTAIKMLMEMPRRKFNETVEVSMNLGVDPRHADQLVRGTILLPHGTGGAVKVLVLTKGELESEAREAGADYVGNDDLIKKISGGWVDFDVVVASPDLMGSVGRLGKILGPRGLMPNPKSGTVTVEVGKAVREAKAGRIEFRVDRAGNIHAPVGKVSFEQGEIVENSRALIDAIVRAKPPGVKGQYIRSVTLCTTMSPGIRIDRASLVN